MASKLLMYAALAIVAILVIAYVASISLSGGPWAGGTTRVAVQLTDPPSVPQGTQQLLVSYSSVEVHVSGSNQSGWVSAQGSGTVDLMGLQNFSETIADASVAANSTINLVRFNISSIKVMINNSTYNVTSPNNQVTVSVTGGQKINSSAAVLVDFYPTVNSHASGNATAYVLVPAATAVVINSNSTVSVNTAVGARSSITAGIRAKLGIGLGGGTCIGIGGGSCGATTTVGGSSGGNNGTIMATAGDRVSNFLVESVNYSSRTVFGLRYTLYPVATTVGANATIQVNDTVGYACDNSEWKLRDIYSNDTALFVHIQNSPSPGGCPI
ncbi:MAG: DUF4382 domain-containing protein [Candidatus Micrarchaeota archaeon]|nr:DUF4382 domain-containing protein [Candidatus Micrarchaeota archaeon]